MKNYDIQCRFHHQPGLISLLNQKANSLLEKVKAFIHQLNCTNNYYHSLTLFSLDLIFLQVATSTGPSLCHTSQGQTINKLAEQHHDRVHLAKRLFKIKYLLYVISYNINYLKWHKQDVDLCYITGLLQLWKFWHRGLLGLVQFPCQNYQTQ